MPYYYDEGNGHVHVGRIIATLLGVVVLCVALGLGVYFLVYGTAETRGRIALHNQQRSATQLQQSYEYFHDTCRDVIAKGAQIDNLQAQIAATKTPASDPFGQAQQQLGQLQGQLTGLKNIRATEAQQYNAKSHEFTSNFMRSSDLPVEIGPPDGVAFSALRCENQGSN